MAGRAYSRAEVVEILNAALGSIDRDAQAKLHAELSTLGVYIENMRAELAQLRSVEISPDRIPSATDELDAVVGETARATGAIMDACEKVEAVATGLAPPAAAELTNAVTSIYEACSFQDITGQRISKVVKTLKHIEAKVADIVAPESPAGLLNGPAIGGPSTAQEDIDKLLASFDR